MSSPPRPSQQSSKAPTLKRAPKAVQRKSLEEREEAARQAQAERRERAEASNASIAAQERKRLQKYGIDTRPAKEGQGPGKYQGNPVTYRIGRGGRGGFMGSARQGLRMGGGEGGGGGGRKGKKKSEVGTEEIVTEEVEDGEGDVRAPGRRQAGPGTSTSGVGKANGTSKQRSGAVKSEGANSNKSKARAGRMEVKREETPVYGIYESDDEEATRLGRDIDAPIEISSDEEADDSERLERMRRAHYLPHRLQRQKHQDRILGLNLEASSATAPAGQDEQLPNRKGKARVSIKPDPEVMDGEAGVDATAQQIEISDDEAPGTAPVANMVGAMEEESKEDVAAQIRRRKPPVRAAFATYEEQREYERREKDLQDVQREFGQITVDSESDAQAGTTDDEEGPRVRRAGHLDNATYIFQFPPILPDLHTPRIKGESEGQINAGADSSAADNAIAGEDEPPLPPPPKAGESRKPYLEPGHAGKLRIHQSGKMTMSWGGTSLAAEMGTVPSFLQSVMLMQMHQPDAPDEGKQGQTEGQNKSRSQSKMSEDRYDGSVTSYGQVRGKIIVTPDWEEVLG